MKTRRWVDEMPSPAPEEIRIKSSRRIDCPNAGHSRPLERGRIGPRNGQGPGQQVKHVLKCPFDAGEDAAAVVLDLLHQQSVPYTKNKYRAGCLCDFKLASWTILCAERSNPQRPTRLKAVATANPTAGARSVDEYPRP